MFSTKSWVITVCKKKNVVYFLFIWYYFSECVGKAYSSWHEKDENFLNENFFLNTAKSGVIFNSMKPDCNVSATTTNLFSIEWKGKCLAKWKIFMISLLFSTLQLLAETFFYLNDFQSYPKTLQKNKFIFNEANLKILQVKQG